MRQHHRVCVLDGGRYGAAARRDALETDKRSWRETAWRKESAAAYPKPRQVLHELPVEKPLADLLEQWLIEPVDKQRANWASGLRSRFGKWVFSPKVEGKAEKKESSFLRVRTDVLREYLADQQPTFTPQLHDIMWLTVVAVEKPTDTDFVARAIEAVRLHGENAVTILLCPGLKGPVREALRRKLHDRGAFAAAVDDLDLCRLADPAGAGRPNRVLGLLEIALEQQPWALRGPFSLAEGGDMRLEMYVGRRAEAEKLATSGDFTRVFSGRKLGKTALLHFVRRTMNNRTLGNGRVLRVVYVGVAGVRNEETFIRKVLEELRVEFPGVIPAILRHTPDLFIDALRKFLAAESVNLLIVLDEADEFVQAQIDDYSGAKKEAVLSFRLRSEKYGYPDETRVRCVYTGYRTTNTDGGAWVNAGNVLKLSPLTPDEAAGLVGRPLARMGIDAAEAADDIAFRCGYQPAVLLKFGARLVKRLADKGFSEGAAVTPEDVIEVAEDDAVREEIRRVVRANFQGNPLGQAVFAVVLDRLARLPQGHGLRDAVGAVANDFQNYWGTAPRTVSAGDPPGMDLIATQFKDMVERGLLDRLPADGGYRLKFPHHLPTLFAELNVATELKANLGAWRQQDAAAPGTGRGGEFRGPLRRKHMIDVRELLDGGGGDATPAAVAAGTLWPAGLNADIGGLAERLGLDAADTGDAGPAADWETRRLWRGATPSHLGQVLSGPRPARPPVVLTGGADLLRAAHHESRARPGAVEPVGPYRLTDGRVRWWFQRVRGVEFSSEKVYADVFDLTHGVPLLVGLYDRLLIPGDPPADGLTTNAEEEAVFRAAFLKKLNGATHGLGDDGPPESRLASRERELVRMVHTLTAEFPDEAANTDFGVLLRGFWVEAEIGGRWAEIYPGRPFPARYEECEGDAAAVELLLMLGLLRSKDGMDAAGRIAPFLAGDPVVAIWSRLG